jgi:hypothetical protein
MPFRSRAQCSGSSFSAAFFLLSVRSADGFDKDSRQTAPAQRGPAAEQGWEIRTGNLTRRRNDATIQNQNPDPVFVAALRRCVKNQNERIGSFGQPDSLDSQQI